MQKFHSCQVASWRDIRWGCAATLFRSTRSITEMSIAGLRYVIWWEKTARTKYSSGVTKPVAPQMNRLGKNDVLFVIKRWFNFSLKIIPGHFFNIEHSPYLFPMFSFKKHRSMHVCNHVTKVTKISTWQINKMVKLFEKEIHIMQLFYAY
jgi:hypothetical protein